MIVEGNKPKGKNMIKKTKQKSKTKTKQKKKKYKENEKTYPPLNLNLHYDPPLQEKSALKPDWAALPLVN